MWEINCGNGYDDELYGAYRNKKFTDFYPTYEKFEADYNSSGFFRNPADDLGKESRELLWRLLYARYGNSTIANADEHQFKFRLFSIIFQYGPTWVKELDIQREVRGLTAQDLEQGNTQIMKHAYAPGEIGVETSDYINEQNTSSLKRSKLDQYDYVLQLLKRDVTETFINKFRTLFLTVVAPERALLYEEEE